MTLNKEKEGPLKKFGISKASEECSFYGLGEQYIWLPATEGFKSALDTSQDRAFSCLKEMYSKNYNSWHFMQHALNLEDMTKYDSIVQPLLSSYEKVILLGTGGSSLGAKALCELVSSKNLDSNKICFFDNVDPQIFESLASQDNLEKIAVLVITKSGSTPETLAQFTYLIDLWNTRLGKESIEKQFLCITEEKDSPIHRLAQTYKIRCLSHDALLGGRFSVVSKVGLLPFGLCGGDVNNFQKGLERVVLSLCKEINVPASTFIGVHDALEKTAQLQEVVLMTYGDAWRYVPSWFMQLWAESLGKKGKGTTPIGSQGTQDQHSLLQLFLDGPDNKLFTIVISKDYGESSYLRPQDKDLKYLEGKTMGELIEAEAWATVRTLVEKGRPVRVLHLDNLSEITLGACMLNWMIETALQAQLWDIDAFDQPAVEKGKILTKDYLRG